MHRRNRDPDELPTTGQAALITSIVDGTVAREGVDATSAAKLLAHGISVQREHDGSAATIDYDPPEGPRLQLRHTRERDDVVALTLPPERTAPKDVERGQRGLVEVTRDAVLEMLRGIEKNPRWSAINPELHTTEELIETHRHTVSAKDVIERWIGRAGDRPHGGSPRAPAMLAALIGGLHDAAETTVHAGWTRADDRGHPARLGLTVFGRQRRHARLERYQRGDRTGRQLPIEATSHEQRGFAHVELDRIAEGDEVLIRCATMELLDAYDEQTRKRSSAWLDRHGWERLLRSTTLNWAWGRAAENATGNDLCQLFTWHTW